MDFLKKAEQSIGGNSNNNNQDQQQQQQQQGGQGGNTNNNAGTEDYGDKGLDFIEKKAGYTESRDTNEKITDGARGLYEKATGNKVDPKWSN